MCVNLMSVLSNALSFVDSYERAVEKMNMLETISSVTQSDENSSDLDNCRKRTYNKSSKYNDYINNISSDDDCDIPNICFPKKKSKRDVPNNRQPLVPAIQPSEGGTSVECIGA